MSVVAETSSFGASRSVDADAGGLASQAEQASLSAANDVDFDVSPICVELP